MSSEDNLALYYRIIDAINANDPAALDDLCAPDLLDHNPVPGQGPGLEGFKQWMASMFTWFANLHCTVDDAIASGDKVAARVTWRGVHAGEIMDIPATNRPVEIGAMHLVRMQDGKAAEWWGIADLMGLVRQIS
jgi:predicted ester cyclase